jgi:hypothetical protein
MARSADDYRAHRRNRAKALRRVARSQDARATIMPPVSVFMLPHAGHRRPSAFPDLAGGRGSPLRHMARTGQHQHPRTGTVPGGLRRRLAKAAT